jgi:hypothetical protein
MGYDVRVLPPASGHSARDSRRYWERGGVVDALEAATFANARQGARRVQR